MRIWLAREYGMFGASRETLVEEIRRWIPGLRNLNPEEFPLLLTEVFPRLNAPYLPTTASNEEIVTWLTLVAERALIMNGATPEMIAQALEPHTDEFPLVLHTNVVQFAGGLTAEGQLAEVPLDKIVEFQFAHPAILWAKFPDDKYPRPDPNDMLTVGDWIWGCTPEIWTAEPGEIVPELPPEVGPEE